MKNSKRPFDSEVGSAYGSQYKNDDQVLKIIKNYNLALFHAKAALDNWGNDKCKTSLIKTQKAVIILSQNKLPMIPQLDNLYRYFKKLIFRSQNDDKEALLEFIKHMEELKDTWVEARKLYYKKAS